MNWLNLIFGRPVPWGAAQTISATTTNVSADPIRALRIFLSPPVNRRLLFTTFSYGLIQIISVATLKIIQCSLLGSMIRSCI